MEPTNQPGQPTDVNQPTTPTEPALPPVQGAENPVPMTAGAPDVASDTPTPVADYSDFNVDYLDKIAANPKKSINKFAIFGLIGGVIAVAVIALIIMTAPKADTSSSITSKITNRIDTLQSVVETEQKRLGETHLVETNAVLRSVLGTMGTELTNGVKINKSETVTAIKKQEKTYKDTLLAELEDAHRRGSLDRTYAAQIKYELNYLRTEYTKLSKTSGASQGLKTVCSDAIEQINTILDTLDKFDSSIAYGFFESGSAVSR